MVDIKELRFEDRGLTSEVRSPRSASGFPAKVPGVLLPFLRNRAECGPASIPGPTSEARCAAGDPKAGRSWWRRLAWDVGSRRENPATAGLPIGVARSRRSAPRTAPGKDVASDTDQ